MCVCVCACLVRVWCVCVCAFVSTVIEISGCVCVHACMHVCMFVLWVEEVWLEGGGGVVSPLGERVQRSVPQAVGDSSLIN